MVHRCDRIIEHGILIDHVDRYSVVAQLFHAYPRAVRKGRYGPVEYAYATVALPSDVRSATTIHPPTDEGVIQAGGERLRRHDHALREQARRGSGSARPR